MLNSPSRISALGLAAAVWACSSAQPPQPTLPPQPVVAFDGNYVGTIRSLDSMQNQNWCVTPAALTIRVSGGAFSYTLSHPNLPHEPFYNPNFMMHIASDGSFRGPGGDLETASMKGRITGAHMVGQIDGSDCSYAFIADRR